MLSRLNNIWIATVVTLMAALFAVPVYANDTVTIQLDWVVRGDHAMFFVAKKEGYFAKNGIKVSKIRKGSGSLTALRQVGNGNADFGFGDLATLTIARSQGVPVVAIAAVNQKSPLAMITLAKKHVLHSPADLKGLNIGVDPAAGSAYFFLRTLLKANGLKESDVHISTVAPPYENYLLLGRVNCIPGYVDAEVPVLQAKAGGVGSLSVLLGSKYGYNTYGSGVFTSEKMIKEHPDLVHRFMKSYIEAFKFVASHPKQAAAVIAEYRPEYKDKQNMLTEQLRADIKSTFFSSSTKAHGLGWMTSNRWKETVNTLKKQDVLKGNVSISHLYTDKFLQ